MRKTLFTLVALFTFVALPAYAATISLAPTTISVTKGQTFSVTMKVDGAGTKIYTVKAGVSYPASMLETTNFKLDSAWPLTPPGNSIDNTNGKLVQMGGFVGGFSDTKTFGVITFRAKNTGSATISVTSDSAIYDTQSNNTISGSQGTSIITVTTPTPAPTPTPIVSPKPTPTITGQETVKEEETIVTEEGNGNLSTLALEGVGTRYFDLWYVGLAIVIFFILLIAWRLLTRGRKHVDYSHKELNETNEDF